MDPTQQTPYPNQPGNSAASPLTALLNNKKVLIAVVAFVLVAGVAMVVMTSNTPTPNSAQTGTVEEKSDSTSNMSGQGSMQQTAKEPTVDLESPEAAAEGFYSWYVSHPAPLTSGAYEERQDITEEYKKIMARYAPRGITPGRDPIFNCGVPLPDAVSALDATYDLGKGQALVILQDAATKQALFQVKLQNVGNKWLIRDVWCP